MQFFRVIGEGSAGRFLTHKVGGSEKLIREEADRSNVPGKDGKHRVSVMFIDEFDTLGGDRNNQV